MERLAQFARNEFCCYPCKQNLLAILENLFLPAPPDLQYKWTSSSPIHSLAIAVKAASRFQYIHELGVPSQHSAPFFPGQIGSDICWRCHFRKFSELPDLSCMGRWTSQTKYAPENVTLMLLSPQDLSPLPDWWLRR